MKQRYRLSALGWLLLGLSCVALAAGAYNDFLQSLAQRESSGNGQSVNKFGYAGLVPDGGNGLNRCRLLPP